MIDIGGQFCRVKWEQYNLDSFVQIKDYLLKHGWKPTQWNMKGKERGSPKLTEDSFHTIESDLGQLIARRSVLIARRRLLFNIGKTNHKLTGLLNFVRDDGRISAEGIPQGTPTGRYRHSKVVNIPKAMDFIPYGKEVRELFIPSEGHVMVGSDAAALEARMEAHYCYQYTGGVEYARELIEGDIHQKNAELFGTDRNGAKSPKYALTYGAYPPKLAATIPCELARAQELYDLFWSNNTALAEFREAITSTWQRRGGRNGGYLRGLDGRKLFVRSPHSAVNMMFQSGGSIIVKTATILLDKWLTERYTGIQWEKKPRQVIHYHDEFQFEMLPSEVDSFTELSKRAFQKAGEYWNLNVPIEGDVQVGNNWAQTH